MSFNGILKQAIIILSRLSISLPESVSRTAVASTGLLAGKVWYQERNRLKEVIDRVYFRLDRELPMDLDRIIDRMFLHFSLNSLELLQYPMVSEELLRDRFNFVGTENLDNALKKGKGVILALPHLGNWELLGAAIAHRGYKLNSFFLSQKEDELGNILDYFRSFSGIVLHDRDRGGIKALKALRNGESLGMIADQDGANNGVYMNFLGHWVSMPAGPANWSLKTGAELVPLYCLRDKFSNKFEARILPALPNEESGNHREKVIARTKKLANWMEEIILENPSQYLWFYDRFKPRHEKYIIKQKNEGAKMVHGGAWYG
jgi:KDO2-lipid IV(A) lauroyltransferase